MLEITLLQAAGAAVIGGGISIGTQLIVAYLKQGKNGCKENNKKGPLSGLADPSVTVSDCRRNRTQIADWKLGIDKCLVKQKSVIDEHSRLLDKGSRDFEAIKKDISGINISLAVFAERLKSETSVKGHIGLKND